MKMVFRFYYYVFQTVPAITHLITVHDSSWFKRGKLNFRCVQQWVGPEFDFAISPLCKKKTTMIDLELELVALCIIQTVIERANL